MTLTLHSSPVAGPPSLRASNIRLIAAGPALWRVVDPGGRVIGHLEALSRADGVGYRARRFHAPSGTFRDLGEFWSPDDAVDCVRLTR